MGKPWGGNDMIKGPGGGYKVILLKEYLSQFEDSDDRLILFSDSYDAVLLSSPQKVLDTYYKMVEKYKCDVIFSAESLIWPDEKLANLFPPSNTIYKYLNSGGFIGKIKDIKKIIMAGEIKATDDDQLYYQIQYINSINEDTNLGISFKLDVYAEIFQTLSSHFDYINIDYNKSKIINSYTKSNPLVLHGNGGIHSKLFLNKLCNYINLKYRDIYGYKDLHSNLKMFVNKQPEQYPVVRVISLVENSKNLDNLDNIFRQNYPIKKATIINLTNNNIDIYIDSLKIIYKDVNINENRVENNVLNILNTIYNIVNSESFDYLFLANSNHCINDFEILKKLIKSNLPIIAPMLNGKNNTSFTNFWGDVSKNGFYKRSFDYFNIASREYKGYWNIPYISGSILFSNKRIRALEKIFNNEKPSENEVNNYDMYISRCIRMRYNFMYIMNFDNYGYILD